MHSAMAAVDLDEAAGKYKLKAGQASGSRPPGSVSELSLQIPLTCCDLQN